MASESSVRQRLQSCVWLVLSIWKLASAQETPTPNLVNLYPVHIGGRGDRVQGRIDAQAKRGQLVPCSIAGEGKQNTDVKLHLKVEVRASFYKRPHMYSPISKMNNSDPQNLRVEHPAVEFSNDSLPYGMQFVVLQTNAFYVNQDMYIAVNDFSNLQGQTRIHFDVILVDNLADILYVSNHLHFVVDIGQPTSEQQSRNALPFVGVLVLAITAISLLIPFVVRAKRRRRAGKPICGCGSADDVFDGESLGSVPDYVGNKVNSVEGKDNLAMILENGNIKNHRSNTEQHTTIQNHMLRSTSSIHFQPPWMDPHYNDVYIRPDFCKLKRNRSSGKLILVAKGRRPSFGRVMSSSRSSHNSACNSSSNLKATKSNREEEVWRPANVIPAYCDPAFTANIGSTTTNDGASTSTVWDRQTIMLTSTTTAPNDEEHVHAPDGGDVAATDCNCSAVVGVVSPVTMELDC